MAAQPDFINVLELFNSHKVNFIIASGIRSFLLKLRRHFLNKSHAQIYRPDIFAYLRQSAVEKNSAHDAQDAAQGKSIGSADFVGDASPDQTAERSHPDKSHGVKAHDAAPLIFVHDGLHDCIA